MSDSPSLRRRLAPLLVSAVAVAAVTSTAVTSTAVTSTAATRSASVPAAPADAGASWLAGRVGPDGSVEGGFDPLGDAAPVALALAAAGVEEEAFDRAVNRIVTDVGTFVAPYGTDDPGRLGRLLQVAAVAGLDPHDVGGVDVPARLAATLGAHEPGLYGAADPTYDGAFRQALAIAGLVAVGEPVPAAATDWLVDQQCNGAEATVAGSWMAYRSDTSAPCPAPDPVGFTGPDSNSTALGWWALSAAGVAPGSSPESWVAATQEPDGGWAFHAGGTPDPNSTALVIRALLAAGTDPAGIDGVGTDPLTALGDWQLPCGGPDGGAFASPYSAGAGDLFASVDAVPALAGLGGALSAEVDFAVGEGCRPAAPSTTATTTSTTSTPTTSTPTISTDPTAPPAVPIPGLPRFTG